MAAQTQDFDQTVFSVEVYENGSARWTFVYKRALDTNNDTERRQFETFAEEFNGGETPLYRDFKNRSKRLTTAGSDVTGREMSATDFRKRAYVTPLGNQGVVEMSFLWDGFAFVDGKRVVVGDVFEGGLYLGPDQRFVVSWGGDLSLVSAAPQPKQQDNDTVVWVGGEEGRQFLDGNPQVVLAPPESANGTADPGGDGEAGEFGAGVPLWSAGVVLAVALLAVGTFLAYRFDVFDRFDGFGGDGAADGPGAPGRPGPPGAANERRGDRTTTTEPSISDEALLTDEDRVMNLLAENGGRMKQVNIVEETDWSKSKVSMLLSDMEEEGYISKLRVGRENIISRAGDEPRAARSPFDDDE
ncbi:helix-turn-helix transcriptional regulator [Halomarina pelagica]|uniref:helix-turn-helix transcriptional regulator n=1 Tax=Halomarina pelagica TaxID=2961599 RepID=UPI0020C3C9E3|nr:helix-turn-helix domain-containing protein [Halomarina sp. BND7]